MHNTMTDEEKMLKIEDLRVHFPVRGGVFRRAAASLGARAGKAIESAHRLLKHSVMHTPLLPCVKAALERAPAGRPRGGRKSCARRVWVISPPPAGGLVEVNLNRADCHHVPTTRPGY